MAPVVLATVVHCEDCAEKIQKAVKKVPGVQRVTASVESGLVEVEGTADAEALRARLEARVAGIPVTIVTDGAEQRKVGTSGAGTVVEEASSPPRRAAPSPSSPIVLEMKLHCESCATKVKRLAMKIPGVETVTTDVAARRVEVTGTADASTVATTVGARTRRSVKVLRDPGGTGFSGSEHEGRNVAAARATAQHMEQEEGNETVAATQDGSASPVLTPPIRSKPQRRNVEPAPPPPQEHGIPPPETTYYPGPEGWYGGQHWAAPEPTPYPPTGGYYYQGQGEVYGDQQWPTTAYTTPEGCYYSEGPPGEVLHDQHQQNSDENAASNCRLQ